MERRPKLLLIARFLPFVERNDNVIELAFFPASARAGPSYDLDKQTPQGNLLESRAGTGMCVLTVS